MDWWQWLLLITGAWFCLSLITAGLWSFAVSGYRRRMTGGGGGARLSAEEAQLATRAKAQAVDTATRAQQAAYRASVEAAAARGYHVPPPAPEVTGSDRLECQMQAQMAGAAASNPRALIDLGYYAAGEQMQETCLRMKLAQHAGH